MKKLMQKIFDIPTWAIFLISSGIIIGGFVFSTTMSFNKVIQHNEKIVEKGLQIDIPEQ